MAPAVVAGAAAAGRALKIVVFTRVRNPAAPAVEDVKFAAVSLTQGVDDGFDTLRATVDTAVRRALDTDEFRRAIDAVVKQALDDDEFREFGTVRKLLADALREERRSSVGKQVERAVAWPVRRVIAEAVGFDEIAKGTPESLCAVQQASSSVGMVIDAAVREAFNRREGDLV